MTDKQLESLLSRGRTLILEEIFFLDDLAKKCTNRQILDIMCRAYKLGRDSKKEN